MRDPDLTTGSAWAYREVTDADLVKTFIYFETFFYTEEIKLTLLPPESILNVIHVGQHRQVWIKGNAISRLLRIGEKAHFEAKSAEAA